MPASQRIKFTRDTDRKSSPKEQAGRLEWLRKLCNFRTRKIVAEIYHDIIGVKTYTNWEMGLFSTRLPPRAIGLAGRMCADNQIIGFNKEWLLFGVGSKPRPGDLLDSSNNVECNTNSILNSNEEKCILNDLIAFRNHNSNAVDFIVEDDGMEPRFIIGEYVGGIKIPTTKFSDATGLDCIIQTDAGKVLLRKIKSVDEKNFITLACANPNTNVLEPFISNIQVSVVAPVVWQRRRLVI